MSRRFATKKLRFIYLGFLSFCLIVGVFLVFTSGRLTNAPAVGRLEKDVSSAVATIETNQSVLAAETPDSSLAEQAQPSVSKNTAATKVAPKSLGGSSGRVKNTASAPAVAQTPVESAEHTKSEQVSNLSVTLSINDSTKGTVGVASGSNQCDVLSQSLKDGLINSLDMRYYAQFKTQGVYAIDGQGNPDAIWWTFKVNGKSPPVGCSNVPVQDGDRVNWKYIRG